MQATSRADAHTFSHDCLSRAYSTDAGLSICETKSGVQRDIPLPADCSPARRYWEAGASAVQYSADDAWLASLLVKQVLRAAVVARKQPASRRASHASLPCASEVGSQCE